MSGARLHTQRLVWLGSIVVALGAVGAVIAGSLWAAQRPIKSKPRNYANAPVMIKRSDVTLTEVFSTPTQTLIPGMTTGGSRVRYANRAGLLPSTFVLEGGLVCRNKSPQTVEAMGLTVVLLDAFNQPIQVSGPQAGTPMNQVVEPVHQGEEKRIAWQQQVSSTDIFEVAVVVTRVRFADGSVWLAPSEELVDIF
jgi:hypothetical protein